MGGVRIELRQLLAALTLYYIAMADIRICLQFLNSSQHIKKIWKSAFYESDGSFRSDMKQLYDGQGRDVC